MKEHRSLFWPLSLIAAGVIWLLISMGRIPAANLWALAYIWPYVLIALGVGLILRALWRPLGMLVSALVVIGAFAAVFYAPMLKWDKAPVWGIDGNFFGGGIAGSGVVKTETRNVSGFDALSIDYPAEITVNQGASEGLTIEAEDNLLPQLTTEVRGNTLHIEDRESNYGKRVNPTKIVRITITVKQLSRIDFSSAGKLTINNLKGDTLEISLNGAGDVTLSKLNVKTVTASLSGAGKITADGSADNFSLSISGLGSLEAASLTVQDASIEISGAGSATLRVEKSLDAQISGAGSVNYYGSPSSVTKSISGAGNIKQMGN